MFDDQSKRYENIDALIKAAEVLERNEILSKSQLGLEKNKRISNIFGHENETNYYRSKNKLDFLQDSNFSKPPHKSCSDSLMETIECINELRKDERLYSLLENKLKSDNRALYQELNHLKRKLNKIQHVTSSSSSSSSKKYKFVDKSYEDEDTSTASEDEDYNKYDSKTKDSSNDPTDDATDDASECEEISRISRNSKIYGIKHIAEREISRSKSLISENQINRSKNYLSTKSDCKRKRHARNSYLPDVSKIKHSYLSNPSMTLSNHAIWDNCARHSKYATLIPLTRYGLIPSPEREVSSKVHRIV